MWLNVCVCLSFRHLKTYRWSVQHLQSKILRILIKSQLYLMYTELFMSKYDKNNIKLY